MQKVFEDRNTKLAKLRARVGTPDLLASNCAACMDGTPSEKRAGKGLSPYLCRRHRERLARNGHLYKPPWRASEFRPFVRVAEQVIKTYLSGGPRASLIEKSGPGFAIHATLAAYARMISQAGTPARDMPRAPGDRVRATLAKLRVKYTEPPQDEVRRSPLARIDLETLAVKVASYVVGFELAYKFDPAPATEHFIEVQIGKAIHRLAGGNHRAWAIGDKAPALLIELNRYTPSRGRTIALLGKTLREKNLIWDRCQHELMHMARELDLTTAIHNWTSKTTNQRRPKGGLKRKPYRPLEQRGHDRMTLKKDPSRA